MIGIAGIALDPAQVDVGVVDRRRGGPAISSRSTATDSSQHGRLDRVRAPSSAPRCRRARCRARAGPGWSSASVANVLAVVVTWRVYGFVTAVPTTMRSVCGERVRHVDEAVLPEDLRVDEPGVAVARLLRLPHRGDALARSPGRRNWEPIVPIVLLPTRRRRGNARSSVERLLERVHLPPADADHLDRGLVEVRRRRADALLDHDRLEVAEQRVLAGRADALVREHAGEQHRLGAERAQDLLEVRLEERREARLLDDPVLGRGRPARRGSRSPTCRCGGRPRAAARASP